MNLENYVKEHGQTATARLLGVSQGLVWQWLRKRTRVTPERAIQIEDKTGGIVTRYEIRPEIFGESPAKTEEAA